MDFVLDQLATGKKIRVLTVVDTFSRFSPIVDPRFSYRAEDVVLTLEQACAAMGSPKAIRVDQGSSSSPATSTCGPMPTTLRWTSRGRASRRTTPSSRRSTAGCGRNA